MAKASKGVKTAMIWGASGGIGRALELVVRHLGASLGELELDFGASLDASMVQQWDGLYRLTHFSSMHEFWDWAQGDGRSTFRDAPPLPGIVSV